MSQAPELRFTQAWVRFLLIGLLVACSQPAGTAGAAGILAGGENERLVEALLADMTPEERVGQLFLVSFEGGSAEADSAIYDLILNHHIGGVILAAENDNFVAAPETLRSARELIAQLQMIEWQSSQGPTVDPLTGGQASIQYIPLLIGISQPGGGTPADQILSGLTALPDEMAIGATWEPTLAEQVGSIAGYELSQVGFNLILGPSLDVLESPDATLGNGLGASVFGGDPYWVAEMAQAYIRGLHLGSGGKLLVVARNFPGRGATDRPEGEEAATVRTSLEQLKQIELAPFFAVTGNADSAEETTDGLLVSHIRYQGFQGNIRATTRPISFDAQALDLILSLPEFTAWSEKGGLLVSDDLGSDTVRRFYDPGDASFQGRLVARDAFLAGNDLLFLGNIRSTDAADTYETVVSILDFFSQKYIEDTAFAQRVDEAVGRILAAKARMYGTFELEDVTLPVNSLEDVGEAEEITFQVARQAVTLVNPDAMSLDTLIPEPPGGQEEIVFITDRREVRQCSTCDPTPMIGVEDMQDAVLRLYGPQAGGQVNATRMTSYGLEALEDLLDGGDGNLSVETSLRQTDWLVINMLDADPEESQTTILRRFLSERQDLLRSKHVILFAFDAPYYLDSTDISKLTVYYCLYSRSAPFVEAAVRVLFQELPAAGSLPVSVSGVGYDLFTALSPDPEQVIMLEVELPVSPTSTNAVTPEMTPTPAFRVGDSVTVRTGVLVDHNGHSVPDGTEVQFTLSVSGEGGVLQNVEAMTNQGVALAAFNIDRPGLVEVRATSDPANVSVILQMDVSGEGFTVTVVAPTPAFSPTQTMALVPTQVAAPLSAIERGSPGMAGWLIMVSILGGLGLVIVQVGWRVVGQRWGWRMGICAALGGLGAYLYLGVRLPGASATIQQFGYGGISIWVVVGALVGLGAGVLWYWLEKRPSA